MGNGCMGVCKYDIVLLLLAACRVCYLWVCAMKRALWLKFNINADTCVLCVCVRDMCVMAGLRL